MGPFDILLARIALGERYRKATAADWRFWLAVLLWFTFTVTVLLPFAQSFMDNASIFMIWLGLTFWAVAGWAFAEVLKKYVPAIIPLVLTVTAWVLYFLL